MIKKTLVSAAVAASLFALSAPASATLINWYIDTDGAGGNAPVQVHDYLDLTGQAFVNNTFTGPASFTFNEVGRFAVYSADLTTVLSPPLTSKFVATGSGTTGGTLAFTPGGTLNVFSGATDIADFILQVGSANLFANSTLPNGTVSLIFKANAMQSGYFFDQFMNDLAPIANSPTGIVLGFATTNAISLPGPVDSSLIADYNTAFNPDIAGPVTPNGTTLLYLSNNGQYRLAVPEPSTLALFGIAMLGAGFLSRRKSQS